MRTVAIGFLGVTLKMPSKGGVQLCGGGSGAEVRLTALFHPAFG